VDAQSNHGAVVGDDEEGCHHLANADSWKWKHYMHFRLFLWKRIDASNSFYDSLIKQFSSTRAIKIPYNHVNTNQSVAIEIIYDGVYTYLSLAAPRPTL
jgi:hypothetical protein